MTWKSCYIINKMLLCYFLTIKESISSKNSSSLKHVLVVFSEVFNLVRCRTELQLALRTLGQIRSAQVLH